MTNLAVPTETMSGFTFIAMPRVAAAQNSGKHTCVHHASGGTNRITCFGDPTGMATGAGHPACDIVAPFDPIVFTDPAASPPTAWGAFDGTTADLVTGNTHSCVLNSGGEAYCWGANSTFELGPLLSSGVPARVDPMLFAELATGFSHTCGITANRMDVYCWGANQYGQVGDGSRYHASPVPAGVYP